MTADLMSHSMALLKPETNMASSKITDFFLPILLRTGYSVEIVFFFLGKKSVIALCSQTALCS